MFNIKPRHVYVPNPLLMVAFTGLEGDVQSLSQELSRQVSSKLGRGIGGFLMNEHRKQHRPSIISPRAMASLTSHVLYQRKQAPYYVEPLVVGLSELPPPSSTRRREGTVATTTTAAAEITIETENVSNDKDKKKIPTEETTTATSSSSSSSDDSRISYRPYLCSMDMIGAKSQSDAFVCAGAASHSIFGTAESLWKPGMNQDELVDACANAFLSALERDCLSGYGAIIYLITEEGVTEIDLASRND